MGFEIGQTAPALRKELRWSEAQAGLVCVSNVDCRIDEKRDVPEGLTFPKGTYDFEAVHVSKAEVEDDETRLLLPAQLNRFAAAGGMDCPHAVTLQRCRHHARQVK